MTILDITAIADIAHRHGALLSVDILLEDIIADLKQALEKTGLVTKA